MIKKIDCNLTQEQYDDVIRYIVIALKKFIKKERKKRTVKVLFLKRRMRRWTTRIKKQTAHLLH